MYKLLIFGFFVSLSASKTHTKSSSFSKSKRIFGGGYAALTTIPYQAAIVIYLKDNNNITCGGSLISNKVVLTAAHCLYNGYRVDVGLGVSALFEIKSSRIFMTSTNFVYHEKYDKKVVGLYDIGLIHLPKSVKFDEYISIVKLPSKAHAHDSYVGYHGRVSGWGYDKDFKLSNKLKILQSVVIPAANCKIPIDDSQLICAIGARDGRTCLGDSGGPLVIDTSDDNAITITQIGIVSYGQFECASTFPDIYTRVTRYLDWIEQNSNSKLCKKRSRN